VEHVAAHGISDLSLRQLAAALGTSHRMLVYHFGSKEGLLVEVVRAVEERQRQALADLAAHPGLSPVEQGRRLWRRLTDPALWPHERLFFEVYGQALQGRPHTTGLLDGVVDSWLAPLTDLNVRHGMPADVARAGARLSLAVTRGLLLDLLATGDREGVDEAMERFIALWEGQNGAGR
jgi:AcrR family transcriptional regulator